MLDHSKARIRQLEVSDLATILEWHNHNEIRNWIRNISIIGYENHLQLFLQNQSRPIRHFFFEYQQQLQGYVAF